MKKMITFLMILFLIGTFVIGVFPTTASAISKSTVQTKINNLKALFPQGSYFTKSGGPCAAQYQYKGKCNSTSCPNCELKNILEYNVSAKNAVDMSIFSGNTLTHNSCLGFACFAFGYIFGHDPYNGNTYEIRSSDYGGINEQFLSQLRPGDFLTCNNGSHYAIFYGYDSDSIHLIDSNALGCCQVNYVDWNDRKWNHYTSIVAKRSLNYETTGTSPKVEHGYPGYTDVITDNNAVVYGKVYKNTGGAAQTFGIRVRPSNATYANGGWTYVHAPSQNYIGNSTVMIWYDIQKEMGVTLTHATSYTYQLLAKIDGTEYWSEEKSFTTTGSHSYGAWVKNNDTTHKRSCTCGKTETANHSWNNGQVTKQPTCKDNGIKTYTCTGCGSTRTETLAQTNAHSYNEWVNNDFLTHKHTCSVCQRTEMVNHNWIDGTVTKQPTCKDYGTKVYTCSGCGTTKTENLSRLTTHTWNRGTVTKQPNCKDYGTKTYTCTVCGVTKTENVAKLTTHTYDNACDTSCNICTQTRSITHNFKTIWSKDNTSHWHECSVCKTKKDIATHTPGAEATETTAQSCTICGYIIKPALNHTHSYASDYTADEKGHWHKCIGCEETNSYTEHDFENTCDKDCSICGYRRETAHTYTESWENNEVNHWHKCAGCGLKVDEEVHAPGTAATEAMAQTCTICDYVIVPALSSDETKEPTESILTTDPSIDANIPTDKTEPEVKNILWGLLFAVSGIVVGGGIAFIVIKKKR